MPVLSGISRNVCLIALALGSAASPGRPEEGGFRDHGVATPVSTHRGLVATRNGSGHDIVLAWLYDCRGGYALLEVDVETRAHREFPMPFPPRGDCPYASILSSKNRFYTHFAGHFVEFDPVAEKFTFWKETKPQMAMAMTEDDKGRIWSVTYPNSGVVCFDPATRTLRDYGWVHKENWRQYPRYVAADDTGWVYFGIGNTKAQIMIFDPETGAAAPVIPEKERVHGSASVVRDVNGKVYGHAPHGSWYELYRGRARRLPRPPRLQRKRIIAGSQGLAHRVFPSGRRLKICDMVEKYLVVIAPETKKETRIAFDYSSEGAHIMDVAVSPDGTLCGGTTFPMRFFSYDPERNRWTRRAAYGQWNTVTRQGDRFYVGGYTHGFLLEWDPARPWVPTVKPGHAALIIGWGYTDSAYYHFRGIMDEIRIYDRALSSGELTSPGRDGLIAWWRFADVAGDLVPDASGHGLDARVFGASPVRTPDGKNALKFDGIDDYLRIERPDGLPVRDALTVVARIFPEPPYQHGYGGLLNNIGGTTNSRLLIQTDGTPLAQVVIDGESRNATGPKLENNAWNVTAYVYDGRREYWIVNGRAGPKHPRTGFIRRDDCNPAYLTDAYPDINRPHDLLAYPDGRTLILAGTPGYGYTGGGLLFWDTKTHERVLLSHEQLLRWHSTLSLAPLPNRRLLGGSTTAPGTGGEKKAKQAELYILNLDSKRIEWHAPLFPGAQGYTDLCPGPRGLIYGVVDRRTFFVFDPTTRAVVHKATIPQKFGAAVSQQGPRSFVRTPQGEVYLLVSSGITRIDPKTFAVEYMGACPSAISAGGDYAAGRIWFACRSHLWSWQVPTTGR